MGLDSSLFSSWKLNVTFLLKLFLLNIYQTHTPLYDIQFDFFIYFNLGILFIFPLFMFQAF